MQVKKLLLISLFACGFSLADDIKNPFITGISQIDELEWSKFQEYQQKSQKLESDVPEAEYLRQRLMGKFMIVLLTISQQISLDELDTKEDVCDCVKLICRIIKNDNDFTALVHRIVDFCEINLCNFVVQHYDQFKELKEQDAINVQNMYVLFNQYVPNQVDIFQVYVDWMQFQRQYLRSQLEQQGKLTLDDLAYTAHKLGEMLQLSTKVCQVWSHLITSCCNGFADLPQTILEVMWAQLTEDLYDNNYHEMIQAMQEALEQRKQFVHDQAHITQEQLQNYQQCLHKVLVSKLCIEQINMRKKILLQEKLLFKN